jgi:hypothetical protein
VSQAAPRVVSKFRAAENLVGVQICRLQHA